MQCSLIILRLSEKFGWSHGEISKLERQNLLDGELIMSRLYVVIVVIYVAVFTPSLVNAKDSNMGCNPTQEWDDAACYCVDKDTNN